jgi:uncharacterized membrane protein YwaF
MPFFALTGSTWVFSAMYSFGVTRSSSRMKTPDVHLRTLPRLAWLRWRARKRRCAFHFRLEG